MELLNPLVTKANLKDQASETICKRLVRELKQLSLDIDEAADEGRIAKFFNNDDNASNISKHTQTLDSIMIDLSASIGLDTNRQITAALARVKQEDEERGHLAVLSHADINTEDENGLGGDVLSRNTGSTTFHASYARIRTGGGHVFSDNKVT
ncbi:hypothetical protein BDV98DRAFT_80999 [Pterulicium gracile]|uniref:Uncharacterized protein n=1 Tax=Pterulicium gracile TaxID=1884261 RepID=A0A5C3QIT7_9AGAR|nr:hypothetical protein BDV98DRAFT_80999 [Pterula gracilis]